MKQIILAIISKMEDEKQKYLLCNSVLDFGQYTGFLSSRRNDELRWQIRNRIFKD